MMKARFAIVVIILLLNACGGDRLVLEPATYAVDSPKYVIGPGDNVSIFVWGNPELSSSVPVRPDGMITTPLVEDVQASGKTSTELARVMEGQLSRYIKNPIVTVYVTGFVGRYQEQIRVIGQAAEPQSIPFRENMTVLDVMIAVGGLTEFANGNNTTLIRHSGGKQQKYRLRLDDLIKDGDIAANVDMMPGDILIIPEAWF